MSDALERLKKRNRPTVPSRDASLTSNTQPFGSQDISTSRYLDFQTSISPESQIAEIAEIPQLLESELLESEQPLKTKQTTLRLEQGIGDRLQDLCRENAVCREVLIEAMFEYTETSADVLQKVLAEAKNKHEQRQQIANLKRAKSMMERFGRSG
jgi:hypothetical protein